MSRTILLLATMVVALVVAGGVALASNHCYESGTSWNCECRNVPAGQVCEGTDIPEGEYIWGTPGNDTIYAYGGHDYIAAD